MSIRSENILSLTGTGFKPKTGEELLAVFHKMLSAGIHGMCFSPYEVDQEPGAQITEGQIRRRMEIIRPYTRWIRTFSCTDGNELIPRIAREYGMKTMVGAWLGTSERINEQEIANAIEIGKSGDADILAVGNEVLYREDLTEEELLVYMDRVKKALPGVAVSYVDAYYEFENRPKVTEACDVILANCYPFWEGCQIDYSFLYVKDMYERAVRAAKGKKVIISETGWPDAGEEFYGAEPSAEHAIRYFINVQQWSREEGIEIFYFSSFDEPWKIDVEGEVGARWGLWDKDERLKY